MLELSKYKKGGDVFNFDAKRYIGLIWKQNPKKRRISS
jgi:hypothetical protein